MKLQQGDYVQGLTKEQFDELMELQPVPYSIYLYKENYGLCLAYEDFLRPFREMYGSSC